MIWNYKFQLFDYNGRNFFNQVLFLLFWIDEKNWIAEIYTPWKAQIQWNELGIFFKLIEICIKNVVDSSMNKVH